MTNGDQFRELVEGYALGALDAQERTAFEAHLAAGCADCETALEEARWLVTQLAYTAPPAEPSEMLKGRLLRTVRAEVMASGSAQESAFSRTKIPVWLWAGVAALFVFSAYSAWDSRRMQQVIQDLKDRAAAELQINQQLQQEVALAQREAHILTDPNSKKIILPAQDKEMPQLEAMWHPQLGICVMGQKVPMPAGNRVLQLWLIPKKPGAKPMPSEMLRPGPDGKLVLIVANPPEAMWETKALAITEEPPGGSQQPTSAPMWVGGVS